MLGDNQVGIVGSFARDPNPVSNISGIGPGVEQVQPSLKPRSSVEHAGTGRCGALWESYIGGRNICCLFISSIDHI